MKMESTDMLELLKLADFFMMTFAKHPASIWRKEAPIPAGNPRMLMATPKSGISKVKDSSSQHFPSRCTTKYIFLHEIQWQKAAFSGV